MQGPEFEPGQKKKKMSVGSMVKISTYKHFILSNFTKHGGGMCSHYMKISCMLD